jgi:hypothetical protein
MPQSERDVDLLCMDWELEEKVSSATLHGRDQSKLTCLAVETDGLYKDEMSAPIFQLDNLHSLSRRRHRKINQERYRSMPRLEIRRRKFRQPDRMLDLLFATFTFHF